jgi:purine-binding chemotaxis protein CheW
MTESSTYLSFTVCGDLFAVNVIKVLEVLQKQQITHVPTAPSYIKGIINFRGDVVPVFESRVKFNLPERPENEPYVIIVLDLSRDNEAFRIGAIVDRVKDVININSHEIKPVPTMNKEFNTEFLQGIFKLNDNFILLLDVEKVFTGDELNAIKETNTITEKVDT